MNLGFADRSGSISPHSVSRPTQNDRSTGNCFFCGRKGHWISSCPEKSKKKSQPSPPSGGPMINGPDIPDLQCPCGAGTCVIRTSKTEKNPGRKFYCCPNSGSGACKFFKWCDEVTSSCNRNVVVESHPNVVVDETPCCGCGAGKCITLTERNGMDAGRKYFACPIRKGQGACRFKQWHDLPGKGSEGDEIMRELNFSDSLNLSPHGEASGGHVGEQSHSMIFQHREQRASFSLGRSEEEILSMEASDDYYGGQSDSEVSFAAVSEYSIQSSKPSQAQADSPRRDAPGGHASVQSGSEGSDSLAGPGVSPQVEGDEDYMSNILLSTARHFANEFLRHISRLSIPCFLRQRNQLVEAIRVITSLGVDCIAFVSQIDDLIQLIDDFYTLSTLAKQEAVVQQLKDQLNDINSEDNCRQARLCAIEGRLRIMDQALVADRELLLAEADDLEETAAKSQERRTGLQKEIERAEQEALEICAALQTGCHKQEQLFEQLRISLQSLQLWD